jgi:2,4-diketo-3-deoxy-L-fuconate hydrolase
MKFFRADIHGTKRVGIIAGTDGILLPERFSDLVDVIEGGAEALSAARTLLDAPDAQRIPMKDQRLLSPIGRFRRDVLCTGWNYWDHFEEGLGKRNDKVEQRPKAPTFFTKGPDAIIGPTDPIGYDPRISKKWDYEVELVAVIGKAGRSIPASESMDHVFGYCLANDISQRDLQRRHGGQWLKGKSLDGTTPLGPWLVTRDEIDLASVRLESFVNGEPRQNALVSQMAFPLPDLIAELSFGMSLRPGDVLLTGTPSGVGYARTPPLYLAPGDEVVARGTGLGELRNTLALTDLYGRSGVTTEDDA